MKAPKPIQFAPMPFISDDALLPCPCSYESDEPCDCKPMTLGEARRLWASITGMNSVTRGDREWKP